MTQDSGLRTKDSSLIPSHRPPPPAPNLFNFTPLGAGQAPPPKQHSAGPTETVTENDARIDKMLLYLRGRGWIKRETVFQAIGVSDRIGRALKAASGGLVISDSQKGYCHLMDCTPDEFRHAANEIRSRVRELQSYLDDMEKSYSTERAA